MVAMSLLLKYLPRYKSATRGPGSACSQISVRNSFGSLGKKAKLLDTLLQEKPSRLEQSAVSLFKNKQVARPD